MLTPATHPCPVVLISLDKDALSLLEQLPDFAIQGFLDKNPSATDQKWPCLGDDQAWPHLKKRIPLLKALLAVDPPPIRAHLALQYGLDQLATVISPHAWIDPYATIGQGSLIQHGCHVLRDVEIGPCCKLNTHARLHHDVRIGPHCTIAPGATLLGQVTLGARCYIGAGAIVLPHLTLGNDVTVGAGAVVIDSLPDGVTRVGVPAKKQLYR